MNKGVLFAASAYIIWGFFPLYFKVLHAVPALQTINHRVAWSFLLLLAVVLLRKEVGNLVRSITRKVFLIYLAAAVLLAVNWYVYVIAVSAGFVVETSLGYFINPLVSVLFGVLLLRERLRLTQWVAVGLAAGGVAVLALSYGRLPWIALTLACTFGTYGLVKKIAPLNSLHGLALETTILFPLASIYLVAMEWSGQGSFGHASPLVNLFLALTGVVTVIPLLLFSSGARRVQLTTLGLLQYVAPTLQFLTGVFIFKEEMTPVNLTGFIIIWISLAIFSIEGFAARHKLHRAETVPFAVK
jgi:chloramphenicol-sensitive protein RarD